MIDPGAATTVYLDHAASTPLRPAARRAMLAALDVTGNASGQHQAARRAKNLLEEAREQVAAVVNAAHPREIVFTSGATEANNLALMGACDRSPRARIVVSAIEHKAVLEPARRAEQHGRYVTRVMPTGGGRLDPDRVASAADASTAFVSTMAANNETGIVQPIREIVDAVRRIDDRIVIHTDAAQLFAGSDIDVASMGVDLLSLSGHKFGAPLGIGLLYVRSGVDLAPILAGGGQEMGLRSGTSNVAGAVAMAAAMTDARSHRRAFARDVRAERDAFEAELAERGVSFSVSGDTTHRLDQFAHVRIEGVDAETLLIRLDQAGVLASAGAACQSGALEPSHVLAAMGVPDDEAREYVRFTFGWDTAPGTGIAAARTVADVVGSLR